MKAFNRKIMFYFKNKQNNGIKGLINYWRLNAVLRVAHTRNPLNLSLL